MWYLREHFLKIVLIFFFSELCANCRANGISLLCLFKVNESESCDSLNGYKTEISSLFLDVPHELQDKLSYGSLADFTTEEIVKLPTNFVYFLPNNKLKMLSGFHLASLLAAYEDDTPMAKKIIHSVVTNQQRTEFLNTLVSKAITNDKVLDFVGETVYKWNYEVKDGKFQKLSNVCGYALARLWAPYVLTRTKPTSIRLLDLLTEVVQKQNHRGLCNKYTNVNWKNLPKSVRRLWSFLAVNQSYPSPLNKWTVEQIAQQYRFLLPDFNNDELRLIPFDELSKMALHDIDFDNSQARFLFSLLMENSTLKDIKILYPQFFFKLSPMQINQFEAEEWADEKSSILSLESAYLSYAVAKQIFNKIASDWLSSKTNIINGWTSEDLRHLPLIYTQPATSFLKFCDSPPSIQALIAVDSYMLTDRQAFYLSGCSSMLSFQKNDPKLLLGLKYMTKAVPVSSLMNIDIGNINYLVLSHLVSLVNDHNLPMALHLVNITNPVKKNYFLEEMLRNENNILFEQLAPLDVPGPIFDILKQLYSNYTDRIDKLPKHMLSVILESNELLNNWTSNDSTLITKGLYNGYTCNFINKLNSVNFIVSISNYNAYLKRNSMVFPKNLQTCVAEAFINYLKLKSKLTLDLPTLLYLEAWEIEAVQGFVLITLPVDDILNSILRDNILYAIGQLSFPELMIASEPKKMTLMVDQYVTQILKSRTNLSHEHLHTLGNLIHFLPSTYLNLVEEQAFKFMIEAGLFDTRICVDSVSKDKWADLIIKSYRNPEFWSSDTLIILSDLLIVLNQNQLNSIPKMSRLNSADIIHTQYADEIEWLSHNIPFYKGCEFLLGDEYVNFTNYLSVLIDFHLVSIQSQLQMISPINDNHQYEEIIKSSETKSKILKPTVLIPVPEFDNVLSLLSPNNLLSKFFSGKEDDVIGNLSTKESITVTTPMKEETINSLSFSQDILATTESTSILDIHNFTTSFLTPNLDSHRVNQNSTDIENKHNIKNPLDVILVPLVDNATNNYNKTLYISNINTPMSVKNNDDYEKQIINDTKFGMNALTAQEKSISFSPITQKSLDIKDNLTFSALGLKTTYNDKNYGYNITFNNTLSFETADTSSTIEYNTLNQNLNRRKKRSFELFFNSSVQITCEALKILGPASIASMKFDTIIYSMSDEELEKCVDLLGSYEMSVKLAKYIWSKVKDKTALHTYGSVLSGLSVDDIKTIDLDINSAWSLELIHVLSEHVKTDSVRKEIIKLFMTKSKSNMPSHLWGSFGSLICQLQPRSFKIIMPNKDLFWKMSSAFKRINVCDTPCIKNLASIAVSVVGQSSSWKTAEVDHMGIVVSGINVTQWRLLLNLNPQALEGISPNTIKCLDEQKVKLMNNSHIKHLTPKSAHALLENHSNLLDFQTREILFKLVNFEIEVDWQPISKTIQSKNVEKYKDNNSKADSIYAVESTSNITSDGMQADSKASTIHKLSLSILSAIVLLYFFK